MLVYRIRHKPSQNFEIVRDHHNALRCFKWSTSSITLQSERVIKEQGMIKKKKI